MACHPFLLLTLPEVTGSAPDTTSEIYESTPLLIISAAMLLLFVILLVFLICAILCCCRLKKSHRLLTVHSTQQQNIQTGDNLHNIIDASTVTNEAEEMTSSFCDPLYDAIPHQEDANTSQETADGLYDDVINLLHTPTHNTQTTTQVMATEDAGAMNNASVSGDTPVSIHIPADSLYEDIENLQTMIPQHRQSSATAVVCKQTNQLYDTVASNNDDIASNTTYSSLSYFTSQQTEHKSAYCSAMYSTLQGSKASCENTVVYSVVDKTKKKKHTSLSNHKTQTSEAELDALTSTILPSLVQNKEDLRYE